MDPTPSQHGELMAALKEMSVAWPNVQTWQGHQILKEILHGELVDQNMSPI